jgi:hypothetical protein
LSGRAFAGRSAPCSGLVRRPRAIRREAGIRLKARRGGIGIERQVLVRATEDSLGASGLASTQPRPLEEPSGRTGSSREQPLPEGTCRCIGGEEQAEQGAYPHTGSSFGGKSGRSDQRSGEASKREEEMPRSDKGMAWRCRRDTLSVAATASQTRQTARLKSQAVHGDPAERHGRGETR